MATTTLRRAGSRQPRSTASTTGTADRPAAVTKRLAQRARGISRRRAKLGLSRTELARRAGCSATMISNLEAGVIPAHSEALPRVLLALDDAEDR